RPTSAVSTVDISAAVTVTVQDSFGNTVTRSTATINVAIATNPSGGVLSGATSVSVVNGVATFSNLSIDRAGSSYTLSATSAGLTGTVSSGFDISPGAATRLAFTTQPTNTLAGASISPSVQVTVLD